MTEKIEIVYREIGPGYYHKYLLYTDSNGNQYAASGWAGKDASSSMSDLSQSGSSGSGSSGSDYGNIITTHAKYDADYPDNPLNPNARGQTQKHEEIKSGEDLSGDWKKITDSMNDIALEGHQYRPLDQNSNSTADEALRRSGLPEPKNDGLGDNWAPGSGNNLPGGSDDAGGGSAGATVPGGTGGGGGAGGAGGSSSGMGSSGGTGGGAAGGTGGGGGSSGAGGTTPPRRDPLVLDLDGDGIETTTTRDGTVILFDHDGDGVKTGTGWVKPDDGWLVLDRNGNGAIDSGRELFGVDTLKSNGQFATDGFDALRDVDADKDGKIDASDSVFANLRIWRDLNQDGISQTNELTTLSANNIVSIGVNSTAVRTDLGNGNVQTAAGTFNRSNGTTGATGETNGAAANLDLLVNTFYRQFTDHIPLTDSAKALPTLRGSGRARDLNEAISLSNDLGNWVQTYTQQTSRQAQIGQLDGFIEKWADTADMKSLKAQADALAASGVKLTYNLAGLTAGTAAYDDFVRKLGIVERFMGFTYGGANGQARFTPLDATSGGVTVTLAAEQIASIALAYDRFKTDIYESLLLQTRLKDYYESIVVTTTHGLPIFSFSEVQKSFESAIKLSPQQGLVDLIEFMSAFGDKKLNMLGWNATQFLIAQLNATPDLVAFTEELSSWTVRLAAATEHNLTGTSRPDLLVGTNTADYLYGRDGNDVLTAKGGNDYLYGDAGNDTLDGGTGNDYLNGNEGSDTYVFNSGWGQDTIYNYDISPGRSDVITFGDGIATSDIVATRSGDDLILSLRNSSDRVTVQSYFYSDATGPYRIDQVRFADGTSWDVAAVKALVQAPTSGADNLYGYASDDTLNGLDGNDTLRGYGGNDTLRGEAGADNLFGGAGNDTLEGGAGNDYLVGNEGSDTYVFNSGWGQDTIYNYDTTSGHSDVIEFGTGIAASDIVATRSGDDLVLSLRNSSDKVTVQSYFYSDATGPYRIDEVHFADGTSWDVAAVKALVQAPTSGADNLYGYASDDNLNGLDGNDTLRGYGGNDTLRGEAGADNLFGGDGNDVLDGGADNDYLYGESGDDSLLGGSGNDNLYGGNSNDTLEGGAGNDYLVGNEGSDTYVFNSGWGQDSIYNYDTSTGRSDVIAFGDGIAASDIVATRSGDDLILSLHNSSDKITVQSYFYSDASGPYRIDQVRFADGTSWDVATVKALVQAPTSGADNLYGYASDDALNGLDGNDTIRGYGGNDTLRGDAGADNLFGGDGNDVLDGGADNDYLYGEAGDDSLQGGAGTDTLYGGNGNDTLEGGAGNDYLSGENGSDTYVFNSGWGQDTIYNYDTTAGRSDVIEFGTGIAASDILATRSGDDLILSLRNSSDKVTVQSYFNSDATGAYRVDLIRFADGTTWDVKTVSTKTIGATNAADNLYGYATDDEINGLDGNDTIRGYGGNDTLRGDAGADTVYGGDGNDSIDGGADNDYLYGEAGDDRLLGGSGNDNLYGGNGNDTLEGGAGNDYLVGNEGSDTYVFNSGWGQDTIYNYDTTAGRSDVITFGTGIAATDVIATRSGDDLILSLRNGSDKVTVQSYFNSDATGPYRTDLVRFADGTSWDVATVKALVQVPTSGADNLYGYASDDALNGLDGNDTLRGYGGNDTLRGEAGADNLFGGDGNDVLDGGADNDYLYGEAGDDSLQGGAGNDNLYGGAGNDTLEGGAGNDYLVGNEGSDTYVFNSGWGQDSIYNYDTSSGRSDVIAFGNGVAASDIIATRSGDDLILSLRNSSDRVTVQSYFNSDATGPYRTDLVRFADGTSWDVAAVKALVQVSTSGTDNLYGYASDDVLNGLDGNDTLRGYGGNDTLRGDAGADTVYGGDGNDSIDGGADNDYLYGEAGDDALLGGSGNDTLYGGNGNDTLEGGAGNDYLVGNEGSDTYVFNTGWGQDTIYNYDATSERSDVIEFGSGIAATDVIATRSGDDLILSLRNGSDKVTVQSYFYSDASGPYRIDQVRFADGTSWDVAAVKALAQVPTSGADNLYGYASDDVLNGLDGNDTIRGYGGNDTLRGEAGADNLFGGDGNDVLDGGADNDYLYGEAGDDSLQGGAGNDNLYGGAGNDTLEGGAGNDYLVGNEGSDTYVFNSGWGQDSIYNYDTSTGRSDVIAFGNGVAASDIIATRSGDDLILSLHKSSHKITVQSYFYSDASGPYRIDQVRFADGTSWDVATVKALVQVPTSGADNLYGYTSDDVLNGLDGNDTIRGYGGNDTLRSDAGADTLYGGDGNDSIDGGADNDYLYGEAGDDALQGSSGNDTLYGGNGNDTLEGGAGNDYLNGNEGSDTYVFNSGWGQDSIYNYDTSTGRSDVIAFGDGIATDQLWFRRVNADLEVSVIGSTDKTTISNWYSGAAYHVDQFTTADGKRLLDTQVDSLVQAMASFSPPASGQSTLPQNYRDALESVITANWK
ncbi:calcium-binding protein [Ralstonia pseudosolanacearum]|uniref:calcium-binding protein n=1 Tax=Ralstonia pseudosolanacearum TaxID=1310165 RepID=UPI0008FC4AC7|nr:calcium-binding protein [Ralstonia pseudosolanacearum]API76060.1 calcium-binding protein [Ralstonia pseudosolanacearum]AVV67754.1 calcium-binding protein [Ralstonia solanacearum OE1-1]